MSLTRREFAIKMVLAVGGLAVACSPDAIKFIPPPTPFSDNKPTYPQTPVPADFKPAAGLSVLNRLLNPETQRALRELDILFPDPLVRMRIVQVLIENDLATKPGGANQIFDMLNKNGQIIGSTLCADSRVICDTIYYSSKGGQVVPQFAVIEERSLGAAPRVFEKGVNVSILATHCNSMGDISGCGALQALAKLQEPGGADFLRHHGIAQDTIDEILKSLKSANPDEQAVIAAKLQAIMNANAHGGERHITVAVRIGHADESMKIIDAFDNYGNRVAIENLPEYARQYLVVNGAKQGQIDAFLARGQKPFEYVLNATDRNTQEVMGNQTRQKGFTFKGTTRPQLGDWKPAISMEDVSRAVSTIDYPLDHDWGKIMWVIGDNEEELALLRRGLFTNDTGDIWNFLARGNTMVEAVVDAKGKIAGGIRITRLNEAEAKTKDLAGLRKIGTTTEVILAQRALKDAQRVLNEAVAAESVANGTAISKELKPIVENLKKVGRVGLKILSVLTPVFDAGFIMDANKTLEKVANMDVVHDNHSSEYDGYGRKGGIAKVLTTIEYNKLLMLNPSIEPYLSQVGLYNTIYTPIEMASSFRGLVTKYVVDRSVFGSDSNLTPKKPSIFEGSTVNDLYKLLVFDYRDPNQDNKQIKLVPVGRPIIMQPMPVSTSFSPNHIDYDHLERHPFQILNTETGEFLITGLPGEMVVPVRPMEPRNDTIVEYYLYLKTDNKGNLLVKNIAYKEKGKTKGLPDNLKPTAASLVKSPEASANNDDPSGIIPKLEPYLYTNDGGALGYMINDWFVKDYKNGSVVIGEKNQVIFQN